MIATAEARKVWTEAELQALPHDSYNYELVDGELVMSPKNNFVHGDICSRLSAALVQFNQTHKLGVVLDSSTGFWMSNRNCRAPDVSFVSMTERRIIGAGAFLDGEQVMPGFRFPVAELFNAEDWD